MVGNKQVIPKVIIFSAGKPPIGSWHQRIRMLYRGFEYHGIELIHIVPYPAPTFERKEISANYIKFCLPPRVHESKRNVFAIYYKIIGTIKGIRILNNYNNIKFIIVPGLDFIQGVLLKRYCKKNRIPFISEIADENGKLFSEERLTFIEQLAKYNQILYEKFILKKADKIFVFTSYLEKKYNKLFPRKNIYRTIPSIIDYNYFKSNTESDLIDIPQKGIDQLYLNSDIKIVYAGACNRTNGLFFFLDTVSKLKYKGITNFKIFFFFVYGNVSKVEKYCEQIGLKENVLIFKQVLSKYIPAIYEKSDILLLPEHGDIVANAGFPGKVSELLASGKSILSTNFSDLSSYLVHEVNAMVAEIGDSKTYTDNLERLMKDPDLRMKLGANAIKTVKEFFDCRSAVEVYLEDE